jgi:hypothetical protein
MICSGEPSIQELLLDEYSRNSSIQELLSVDDLQQEISHLKAPPKSSKSSSLWMKSTIQEFLFVDDLQ